LLNLDKKHEKYFYDIVILNRCYNSKNGWSDDIYDINYTKKKANIF
jgi:hypothetical protein